MKEAAIVEKEALELSEVDRALLVNRLLQSLARPPDLLCKAWVNESDSRMEAYRAGSIAAADGPSFLRGLRARLSQ